MVFRLDTTAAILILTSFGGLITYWAIREFAYINKRNDEQETGKKPPHECKRRQD